MEEMSLRGSDAPPGPARAPDGPHSRCQPEARQAAAALPEQRCRQEQAKTSRAVRHGRFYSICLRLPLQAPAQRDDTSAAGIPGGHDQHV